jgi:RNA polymerase sigma factor (sigma-70 family)
MGDGDDRPDNAALIRWALAGGVAGRQAWDELVRRHARAVWKVLVSFRLSAADREDVFQATWLRALERLHQLRDPDRMAAWLMTIARHEAEGLWRRNERTTPSDGQLFDVDRAVEPLDSERLEDRERHAVARAALARLGEDCRQLVRLLTVEDLTYRDIEEIMGWPLGGVAIRRSRCLEQLRRTPEVSRYLHALARTEWERGRRHATHTSV